MCTYRYLPAGSASQHGHTRLPRQLWLGRLLSAQQREDHVQLALEHLGLGERRHVQQRERSGTVRTGSWLLSRKKKLVEEKVKKVGGNGGGAGGASGSNNTVE